MASPIRRLCLRQSTPRLNGTTSARYSPASVSFWIAFSESKRLLAYAAARLWRYSPSLSYASNECGTQGKFAKLRFQRANPRGLWSFCRKPTGSHRSPRSSVPVPHGVRLMRVMRFCLSQGRSGDLEVRSILVVPWRVARSCPRLGTPGLSPPCSHSLTKIEHARFLLQLRLSTRA